MLIDLISPDEVLTVFGSQDKHLRMIRDRYDVTIVARNGALKLSGAGFVAQRSASVGISGAVRMISTVSRQFIMRMDGKQLRAVASHIRGLAD